MINQTIWLLLAGVLFICLILFFIQIIKDFINVGKI
jgi:hypothetical protein